MTHHKATLHESAPKGSHYSPEDNLIKLQWKEEDHGFHGDPSKYSGAHPVKTQVSAFCHASIEKWPVVGSKLNTGVQE